MFRFLSHARVALRMLRRARGPALILAVGLSQAGVLLAFTAPFLYRPLPYDTSSSLVVAAQVGRDGLARSLTARAFRRIRERADLFEDVCGYRSNAPLRVRVGSDWRVLRTVAVTSNMLTCLGIRQDASDLGVPAGDRGLVLTHPAALRLFGVDRSAPGAVVLDHHGGALSVRRVLPVGQVLPTPWRWSADAFIVEPDDVWLRGEESVGAICRRRQGLDERQVAAALAADPELADPRFTIQVVGLRSWLGKRGVELARWSAITALLFYLLSVFGACGLMGVKAADARHQWFIHRALGASTLRLGRDLLCEAMIGAVMAAIGSLVIAWTISRLATALVPAELLQVGRPGLDGLAVGAIAMLAALGAVTAYAPLLCVLRSTATQRDPGEHASLRQLRWLLTVGQATLAMLFVGVASIVLQSQVVMFTQDLGLSVQTTVITVLYPDDEPRETVGAGMDETLARFAASAGVQAAAVAQGVMFDETSIDTIARRPGGELMGVRVKAVRGAYVKATGGRLESGREISAGVAPLAEVIVNHTLAARLWPGGRASGESVLMAGRTVPSLIVGVLSDAFEAALDEPPVPTVYVPAGPWIATRLPVHYLVSGPKFTEPAAARVLSGTAGNPALVGVSTVGDRLSETVRAKSFAAVICSVVAISALLLAWVGIAVVITHAITRRRRELAIRTAVGATFGRLLLTVTIEAAACTFLGLAIGTLASVGATRLARAYIYGPGGPSWVFQAGVGLVVFMSVGGICWLNGRRVSAIDPVELLRSE